MSDKYLDADYQRAVDNMVEREVIANVSQLVCELSEQPENFPEWSEDLFNAYRGIPDYEQAARDHGWELCTGDHGITYWCNADGETFDGTAEELCQSEIEIDAEETAPEVYEHWIVSAHLGRKLEQHGERVLWDFFNLTVWCRCTTGQAISMDSVICDIYDEAQAKAA